MILCRTINNDSVVTEDVIKLSCCLEDALYDFSYERCVGGFSSDRNARKTSLGQLEVKVSMPVQSGQVLYMSIYICIYQTA